MSVRGIALHRAPVFAEMEGADEGGKADGQILVGDARTVQQRHRVRRSFAAVQAALATSASGALRTKTSSKTLRADVARVKARRGLVAKSLEKVACDERLWDRYLEHHPLDKDERANYPSVETVVAFGAWTTHERQRACLAQRDDDGPSRIGLGRHNSRCVLTQLSDHVWHVRYPEFARLTKAARLEYWADVLAQFDGLHKVTCLLACCKGYGYGYGYG